MQAFHFHTISILQWIATQQMKKVRFPHFFGMKKISFVFLVTLEKEDKAMIAVIAIFGIFLLIGTIADTILNIMHLDIVPDSLLKVKNTFF